MKGIKTFFGWIITLILVSVMVYGIVIIYGSLTMEKQADDETVLYAMEKLDLEQINWYTLVLNTQVETEVSRDKIWHVFKQLEKWDTWSTLHKAAGWTYDKGWKKGAKFTQILDLGFPAGEVTSYEEVFHYVEKEKVIWLKQEDDVTSCHIWYFHILPNGGTRIVDVQVLNGITLGLAKPLVAGRWQEAFDESVRNLINRARNVKLQDNASEADNDLNDRRAQKEAESVYDTYR